MAVMGNGNIVVGKRTSGSTKTRSERNSKQMLAEIPKQVAPARGAEPASLRTASHCGAMSQQRADAGMMSTPQQFVHLVGCRDPKTGLPKGR
jgi:hypothetical protein